MGQSSWVIFSIFHLLIAIVLFIRLQQNTFDLKRSEKNLYSWIVILIMLLTYGYLFYYTIHGKLTDNQYFVVLLSGGATYLYLHVEPLKRFELNYQRGQRIYFIIGLVALSLLFTIKNKEDTWLLTLGFIYGICIIGIREGYLDSQVSSSRPVIPPKEEAKELSLRELVEQLISKNKILLAIDTLLNRLPKNHDTLLDETRLHKSRFLEIEKQHRMGTITNEDAVKNYARIANAILKMTKEI